MRGLTVIWLVATTWLVGCTSLESPMTRSDVVGSWQYETGGFLSSVQTYQFREDGTFSFHDTDTIVGLEMNGNWKLETDRLRLFVVATKIRGKPEVLPQEWSSGFLSPPIARRDGELVFVPEEGREFTRIWRQVPCPSK